MIKASTMQFSKGITIRTPTLDRTISLTMDLPFQIFEDHLRAVVNRPSHQSWLWPEVPAGTSTINPRLTLIDTADDEDLDLNSTHGSIKEIHTLEQQPFFTPSSPDLATSNNLNIDRSISTALTSIFPKPFAGEDSPSSLMTSHNIHIFTSPLRRQILFSVANNFAGLEGFPVKDIYNLLRREPMENFAQLMRASSPSYSLQAITQNMFRAAIEAGDATIVDLLIREKPMDIKVNEMFLSVEGSKYTPIERASELGCEDLVKILLIHGADINRTHSDSRYRGDGAVNRAVYNRGGSRVMTQVIRILFDAGGAIPPFAMSKMIKNGEIELVMIAMSANASKYSARELRGIIAPSAIESLDDDVSVEIMSIVLISGADLNRGAYYDYPERLIDRAARFGKRKTVQLLLDSGGLVTSNTLPLAVASGNQDLILMLLTRGADINCSGSEGTPLEAAILLEDAQVLKLIEEHGAKYPMPGQQHFSAVWKAASKVGNSKVIERLIDLEGEISPEELGYALIPAIRCGRQELAKTLIDAGADVNVKLDDTSPLTEALKQRQEDIVIWLLDADVRFEFHESEVPPIVLAADWGNQFVMENLIFAGADINVRASLGQFPETALTMAVKRQDCESIQFLLNLGANIDDRDDGVGYEHGRGGALAAAAENGDTEMARFLLDQGADPNNSEALRIASTRNERLFDLLFERYNRRYPTIRGKFGADILANAVVDGNERIVRQMLERRVNANVLTYVGQQPTTSFGHAIARQQVNSKKCLELLLQNGCNPNDIVSDSFGENGCNPYDIFSDPFGGNFGTLHHVRVTGLLAAIGTRDTSTVELLIRYKADVNFPARRRVKRTPLQRAAEIGCLEIIDLLLNHGANVNAPAAERGGGTALQLAAIGGYIPTACKLLSLKADPNAPASKVDGRTALEGAAEHGRLDMVKVLLNGGAGSGPGNEGQIPNAIKFARDNFHFPICNLLESHLSSRQGSGLELQAGDSNGDLSDFNLDDDPFSFVDFEGGQPS